ncbi:hypothetical protein PCANC_01298 [Puccinia coronata f. sp. avenae]|uniref:Uncharacterized protein n=1 Tax=Puccinia coronata f. sp. avenae TaxID=200324 RepID=A0A2N5W3N7_9BASI|nr:hypothetical protein PCANC_01298 [Puccinia coronata f. sp. avenae]
MSPQTSKSRFHVQKFGFHIKLQMVSLKMLSNITQDLHVPGTVAAHLAAHDSDHKKPLKYFQAEYRKLRSGSVDQLTLLRQSIKYLVGQEFTSLKLLKLWCDELVKIVEKEPPGEQLEAIIYGFYTLLLKTQQKDEENQVISRAVDSCERTVWHLRHAIFRNRVLSLIWNREMHRPQEGLSNDLRSCDNLVTILLKEPRLCELSVAISNQDFPTTREKLPVIEQIFSSEPRLQELSPYTRVAALALLFHAFHLSDEQVRSDAKNIADRFSPPSTPRSIFLFRYERRLLARLITGNGYSGQVPIPEYLQKTFTSPR